MYMYISGCISCLESQPLFRSEHNKNGHHTTNSLRVTRARKIVTTLLVVRDTAGLQIVQVVWYHYTCIGAQEALVSVQ